MLSALSPVASAATSARPSAPPKALGQFGARILDVPLSEVDNPRALAYIIGYLPRGIFMHRRLLAVNEEPRKALFSVNPGPASSSGGKCPDYPVPTRSELPTGIKVQRPTVTLAAGRSVPHMI